MQRITLFKLVPLVVNKLKIPADRVWEMSVSDIFLSLQEPEKQEEEKTAIGQKMVCLALDRQRELRKQLTLKQEAELSDWKAQLM